MHDPPSSRGPGRHTEAPQRSAADKHQIASTVARERVAAIDRRCRIARMADELMPMAVYYGPRPLRPVPLGRFLVEGWWAA